MNSTGVSRNRMILRFQIFILLATLTVGNGSNSDQLWCYECNADLSEGRKSECNDPYQPAPAVELIACPTNDSYVCLKSLIFYKNVHVTVRGCVPSSEKNTYCSFKEAYPDASLECLFCNDYACNASTKSPVTPYNQYLIVSLTIAILLFSLIT